MKQLFLLFMIMAAVLTSDAQTSKVYETDAFSSLHVTDAFQVYLEVSDEHTVTVESPSDLLDKIEIAVVSGTLTVSLKKDKWYKSGGADGAKIKVHVTCPDIREISVSGASKLTGKNTMHLDDLDLKVSGASSVSLHASFDDLKIEMSGASSAKLDVLADHISLRASGASHIELLGSADNVSIACSGSSNIRAGELKAGDAVVACSGAGNVHLWISGDLTASASGGSNIKYKCDGCDEITVKTTGGSSVKKY